MLNVLVSGVVSGALYAIAGLGLVAVYRTSKVLNFALGGIGAVATYVAYNLLGRGMPYGYVVIIAVLVGAALGGLLEFGVGRPLRRFSPLTVTLGTLGALLILQGLSGAWYSYSVRALPTIFGGAGTVHVGSVALSANEILILGVAAVITVLLALLFSRTRLGLAMRAASSGAQTSELLGVNVSRARLAAWMIGGACGALAAMLITPLTYLSPSSFTAFTLTAFAAVVLGGFTSLGGVVTGAVVFGVGINLLSTYLSTRLTDTYTFIGIALVLILRPNGLFGVREHDIAEPALGAEGEGVTLGKTSALQADNARTQHPPGSRFLQQPDRLFRGGGLVGVIVILAVLPYFIAESATYVMALALAAFVAVLGLNVITGYAGQISLGHSGFLALGAYAAAVANSYAGVPAFALLPIAFVVAGLVGLVIALPATRLTGVYLALFTLVFSFTIPELVLRFASVTGGSNGLALPLPTFLTNVRSDYWFMLVIGAVIGGITMAAGKTRLGRGWRAVRDSEPGTRAAGLNPTVIKLGAFAIGSAFAGLSGALTGMLVGIVSPESYGVFISIYMLLAVILGGSGSVFGSLLGALFIILVPSYTAGSGIPTDLQFGVVMLLVLLIAPSGVTGLLERVFQRARTVVGRRRHTAGSGGVAGTEPKQTGPGPQEVVAQRINAWAMAARTRVAALAATAKVGGSAAKAVVAGGQGEDGALLELRGVCSGYGIVSVLHDVSLHVARGEVVALIGANGAGKSTLLRTVSRTITPSAGEVFWRAQQLGGGSQRFPHVIARQGISHVPEGRGIFPDLTVAENLTMGTFGIGGRAADESSFDREEVLEYFPRLRERLGQRAGTLSGGEQQMLAIGRALLSRPALLMLDEPSLGLAPVITQQVFDILRNISASGVSILLVEQNAQAALALADRAYVISAGRITLDGAAADLRNDERVTQTYLAGNLT